MRIARFSYELGAHYISGEYTNDIFRVESEDGTKESWFLCVFVLNNRTFGILNTDYDALKFIKNAGIGSIVMAELSGELREIMASYN
jgi:hypothetical protein